MEKEITFNKGFKIRICSDLDYQGMVVDIVYNNATFATLNQDEGIENIEIKLYSSQEKFLEFSLEEFIEILEKAKKLLIQVNKEPKWKISELQSVVCLIRII